MFGHRTSYHAYRPRRTGSSLLTVGIVLAVLLVSFGALAWMLVSGGEDPEDQPLIATVVRGPFDHVVVEHGEVESSNSVEVQCMVKSRNSDGTAILWVIPEGTEVQEGDRLLTLDSSALEEELNRQRIAADSAEADQISAQALLEQATIAKEEYLEGIYLQEERQIQSEILVAEEALSRAQETARYSQRLAALGFQSELQLKADLFQVEQAEVNLELARGRLQTLQEITREKMLVGFSSEIEASTARLEAARSVYQEEAARLREIEEQIENCTIYAPQAGQVVYANVYSRRGGSAEFVVEPGSIVRERQAVFRLPDPRQMQVKATINESNITLVQEGMPVEIQIGAFGESRILRGRVSKVNKYAEPDSWFSSQVKQYATFVDIIDPPSDIRTGMTAEVRIFVDRQEDALQIPVQAVYEHDRVTYSLVQEGSTYRTTEITIGATNEKMVTITAGLTEGDLVVLNPREHLDKMELPASIRDREGDAFADQPVRREDAETGVGETSELPATASTSDTPQGTTHESGGGG